MSFGLGFGFPHNRPFAGGPSLNFQFAGSTTLDPLITFTRASTATYFDSAGVLQTAGNNVPRLDYNPATLAARGLLIEEQRTNLSTNSVLASAWGSASNASYANTQALAPDGTNTAWKLTEDSANSSHFGSMVNISTTYTSGTTYTVSRFLKASGRNVVTVYLPGSNFAASGRVATFNLTTGVVVSTEVGVTATIQNIGNGWYRCSASAVANATGSGHVGGSALTDNGAATYQGDGVSGAFVWGHQLEAGAFPTSYIPTTTTALTRSADVAAVNTLSPWFNSTAGTIYAEAQIAAGIGAAPAVMAGLDDTTINNRIQLRRQSPGTVGDGRFVSSGGNWTGTVTSGTLTGVNKQTVAYAVSDQAGAVNGTLMSGIVSVATLPTITRLALGDGQGSTPLNGWLRRVTYYPRRLSNAELQAITA